MDILQIVQRLAHAHENQCHLLWTPGPQYSQNRVDLPNDFSCRQIADQTHPASRAKSAPHRAPNLARYAERRPRVIYLPWHVYRLYALSIGQSKHYLGRAVGRWASTQHLRQAQVKVFLQPEAQLLSEIRPPFPPAPCLLNPAKKVFRPPWASHFLEIFWEQPKRRNWTALPHRSDCLMLDPFFTPSATIPASRGSSIIFATLHIASNPTESISANC